MELTQPGFRHDVCSAVHPLGLGSPFFRELPLEDFGLRWVQPEIPYAHPLSPREAVFVERSVEATAAQLGNADGEEYRRPDRTLRGWLVEYRVPPSRAGAAGPRSTPAMARFGWVGALPARTLINAFSDEPAKALFAGSAAHGFVL